MKFKLSLIVFLFSLLLLITISFSFDVPGPRNMSPPPPVSTAEAIIVSVILFVLFPTIVFLHSHSNASLMKKIDPIMAVETKNIGIFLDNLDMYSLSNDYAFYHLTPIYNLTPIYAEQFRASRLCMEEHNGFFSSPDQCIREKHVRVASEYQKLREDFEREYQDFIESPEGKRFKQSGKLVTSSPVHEKYRLIIKRRLFGKVGLEKEELAEQENLLEEVYKIARECVDRVGTIESAGGCVACEESIKHAASLTIGMDVGSYESEPVECSRSGLYSTAVTCSKWITYQLEGQRSVASESCSKRFADKQKCVEYQSLMKGRDNLDNFDGRARCKPFFDLFDEAKRKSFLRRMNKVNKPIMRVVARRHVYTVY